MIQRTLADKIGSLRHKFPVLTLTGPRQSGKTTLLKALYHDLPYVSLEDIDYRQMALTDPRGFLSNYPNGAVFDEVQHVPELFSYIQGIVDEKDIHFVLSGSQNFAMMQSISQSLAGRTAVLKLLPFSMEELKPVVTNFHDYESLIFKGMYPRVYDKNIDPPDFFPPYITTYIEKDVRQVKNVDDLNSFSNFVRLCAGRTAQLLNLQSLAMDAGIAPNTAKAWLSVLQAGFIVYTLLPYHQNFNKRIVKSPKLYFYDTGLVCSLLGLENEDQLRTHYMKGALFENFIINEFIKARLNRGKRENVFFWQNKTRHEIDLIIETAEKPIPVEIKAGKTKQQNYFDNLRYWQKLSGNSSKNSLVIYGGTDDFKTPDGKLTSWKNLSFSSSFP